jgi:RimJ/RimL family protein N-acetyltransferase
MTIQSDRLDLIPMTPAFLTATVEGDRDQAQALLGWSIPPDWFDRVDLARFRLAQLRADPGLQPWLLRAMCLRRERRMIGHIGFHSRPGAEDLQEIAPGGVELGYTVYPDYRRQGYAYEACQALMEWAHANHGVTRFVVSISPKNAPSLGLARKLGFVRVGSHLDERDGLEHVFERRVTTAGQ